MAVPTVANAIAGIPLGFQQITASGGAQPLTPPTGATMAVLVPAGAAISWRDDGTPPTLTIGMQLAIAAQLNYAGTLSKFQLIGTSGAGNVINVSYYG